jgi:hypothetical protein
VRPKRFMSLCNVWHKLCTYLAPKLTLSLTDQNKILHDPRQLGVPSGVSEMISEPVVCLVQTVHLSCVKITTIPNRMKQAST